jgi:hypothetical protein
MKLKLKFGFSCIFLHTSLVNTDIILAAPLPPNLTADIHQYRRSLMYKGLAKSTVVSLTTPSCDRSFNVEDRMD